MIGLSTYTFTSGWFFCSKLFVPHELKVMRIKPGRKTLCIHPRAPKAKYWQFSPQINCIFTYIGNSPNIWNALKTISLTKIIYYDENILYIFSSLPYTHEPLNSQLGGYYCTCEPGWTGLNCNIELGLCSLDPCLNSGTCIDHGWGFSCLCAPGFEGSRIWFVLCSVASLIYVFFRCFMH